MLGFASGEAREGLADTARMHAQVQLAPTEVDGADEAVGLPHMAVARSATARAERAR